MISVVIPLYNCEKYINECLDSVLANSFSDYELIIINDGSIDNSLKIAEEYSKKDPRIKVYSQENRGVSYTRNRGIKLAKGDYISFIDADDYVDKYYLEELYFMANRYDLDWVTCGHRSISNSSIQRYVETFDNDIVLFNDKIDELVKNRVFMGYCYKRLNLDNLYSNAMCLYKRSVLVDNNLFINII